LKWLRQVELGVRWSEQVEGKMYSWRESTDVTYNTISNDPYSELKISCF